MKSVELVKKFKIFKVCFENKRNLQGTLRFVIKEPFDIFTTSSSTTASPPFPN